MKKNFKVFLIFLFTLNSCNEPETTVTNIVRVDGAIERRIEMRGENAKFNIAEVQVPYDSTWSIRDSLEINTNGDTIRVRRAIKMFGKAEELNNYYSSDNSLNRSAVRRIEFRKKFRWFNTHYRFSEIIEKRINHGYPVASFMPDEELRWFYLPDVEKTRLLTGPDSLKYKVLDDSVNSHQEIWMFRSLISEWINIFNKLTGGEGITGDISEKEETLYNLLRGNMSDFDSLWSQGVILKKITGEKEASEFKEEADSAMKVIEEVMGQRFSNYNVRIVMPGKQVNSNSTLKDNTGVPLWQVRSEFFLTEPYIMKAESIVTNVWAWIITGTVIVLIAGTALLPSMKQNPV
ncbi:MAG: hypothetical protein WBJ37_03275 [Bacteroidales bacterium]